MHINPPGLVRGEVNAGILEELNAVLGIHVFRKLEFPAPPPSASPRYTSIVQHPHVLPSDVMDCQCPVVVDVFTVCKKGMSAIMSLLVSLKLVSLT
jgi:hypothetical protein